MGKRKAIPETLTSTNMLTSKIPKKYGGRQAKLAYLESGNSTITAMVKMAIDSDRKVAQDPQYQKHLAFVYLR